MTEKNMPPAQPSEAQPSDETNDDGTMSLVEHLTELRSRIIKSLLAVVVGSCVGTR